jgi:hypothetical protein
MEEYDWSGVWDSLLLGCDYECWTWRDAGISDTASSYGAADLEFDQRRPPASKTDTTTNLCDD